MAEGKKSFVLYSDLLSKVDHLTDEEMGKLFRHLLEYVNDLNPKMEDRLLLTAWKPIQASLKADLDRWEEIRKKRAEAGKKGGKQSKAKQANASFAKQNKANEAVTVTDTVTVTVTDTVNVEEGSKLPPSTGAGPSFEDWKAHWRLKGKDENHIDCENAWNYYEERGWTDKMGNKVVNWKNKMTNLSWFKECPSASFDLDSEHCKETPPKDWLDNMINRWGFTRKQAKDDWRRLRTHRADYYNPPKINPSGL
jgi:hypothetical protein